MRTPQRDLLARELHAPTALLQSRDVDKAHVVQADALDVRARVGGQDVLVDFVEEGGTAPAPQRKHPDFGEQRSATTNGKLRGGEIIRWQQVNALDTK